MQGLGNDECLSLQEKDVAPFTQQDNEKEPINLAEMLKEPRKDKKAKKVVKYIYQWKSIPLVANPNGVRTLGSKKAHGVADIPDSTSKDDHDVKTERSMVELIVYFSKPDCLNSNTAPKTLEEWKARCWPTR
ncbi:hypothetical protein ACH5RR_029618 [Cinchona calisaya]|uniref:Chromo domain-containing protein n=1 Tax=Cinchona calisaya TaxID=153742 RepID=A0ABD2YVH5_9GENT